MYQMFNQKENIRKTTPKLKQRRNRSSHTHERNVHILYCKHLDESNAKAAHGIKEQCINNSRDSSADPSSAQGVNGSQLEIYTNVYMKMALKSYRWESFFRCR